MEQLANLPNLTIDQANAVEAWFAAGSIIEAASMANMSLARYLDVLADEAVQKHVNHANHMTIKRAETRLAEAAQTAINTLERIAENNHADPTERRRAATTILRTLHPASRNARPRAPKPIDLDALSNLLDRFDTRSTPPHNHHRPTDPPPPRPEGAQTSTPEGAQPPRSNGAQADCHQWSEAQPSATGGKQVQQTQSPERPKAPPAPSDKTTSLSHTQPTPTRQPANFLRPQGARSLPGAPAPGRRQQPQTARRADSPPPSSTDPPANDTHPTRAPPTTSQRDTQR